MSIILIDFPNAASLSLIGIHLVSYLTVVPKNSLKPGFAFNLDG